MTATQTHNALSLIPPTYRGERLRFGRVIYFIIGGENADFALAAQQLKISETRLRRIISNNYQLSRAYIERNDWAGILGTNYPDTCKLYKAFYEQEAAKLVDFRYGEEPIKPPKENTFAHALWLVLDRKTWGFTDLAKDLGLHEKKLKSVLSGQVRISAETIDRYKWRAYFATHYPVSWEKNRDYFERKVLDLAPHKIQRTYTYSRARRLASAAKTETVDVKTHTPEPIPSDAKQTSPSSLVPLKTHTTRNGKALATTARKARKPKNALTTVSSRPSSKPSAIVALRDWKVAAGAFVKDIRTKMGDDITHLVDSIGTKELRDPQKWQSVEDGSLDNPTRLIKAAIRETYTRYNLAERPDKTDYNKAQNLIESCP